MPYAHLDRDEPTILMISESVSRHAMSFSVDSQDLGDFSEVLMEIMFCWQHQGWIARHGCAA